MEVDDDAFDDSEEDETLAFRLEGARSLGSADGVREGAGGVVAGSGAASPEGVAVPAISFRKSDRSSTIVPCSRLAACKRCATSDAPLLWKKVCRNDTGAPRWEVNSIRRKSGSVRRIQSSAS